VGGKGITKHASWTCSLAMAVTFTACQPPDEEDDSGASGPEEIALAEASACPRPPAGTEKRAVEAYDRMNGYRKAVGLPCSTFVPEIAAAATSHCAYYIANRGSCVVSPHREVATCQKFKAERFGDRMRAASYMGNPAYEAMTYVGDGAEAVDKWVDSVWHRLPILSPYVQDAGYGSVGACDTMNFGWAPTSLTQAPVAYPYDGQAKVPTSFDGRIESPILPEPPKGWPSGYPILVYASDLRITTHELLDDKMAPVPHIYLAPEDPASMGLLRSEVVMYSHAPLRKKTTYHAALAGTRAGAPFRLEWSFTTR
jgi:uncharacterized protein YkwD